MRLQLIVAVASTAAATYPTKPLPVENVIAFGDSYTDSGRLSAYVANNGSAPPPATDTSTSNFTASGGYSWGHFATQHLGAKFYDYAGMTFLTDMSHMYCAWISRPSLRCQLKMKCNFIYHLIMTSDNTSSIK